MIDDPLILQRIVMMSLSSMTQPVSKVYTKLNIVDEYNPVQNLDKSPTLLSEQEEFKNDGSPLIASYDQAQKSYNTLIIKVVDTMLQTTKLELFYKSHSWKVSKG